MTDTTTAAPAIPAAVSQQVEDFRASLVSQPGMIASFDALLPRLINAVVDDLDQQATTDTKNIPLGGLAAALLRSAIDGAGVKAEADAKAWIDANLGAA